jgi:stage V sporulation protein S
MENLFKVSTASHSTAIAGAIAKSVREGKTVLLQTIGAGAVNQAVKAISIARSYLIDDHLDVVFVASFVDLEVDGNERTAIRLHVGPPGTVFPPATPIARSEHPISNHNGE